MEGGGATREHNETNPPPKTKTPKQTTPISLPQESQNKSKLYTPKSPGSLAGGADDPNGSSESSSLGNLSPLKINNLSGSRTPKTPRSPRSFESLEASLIEAGDLSPHSSNPSHTSTPNPFFDPNIFNRLLEDSIDEDAVVPIETLLKEGLTHDEIKRQREVVGRSDQAILRWAKEKQKKAQRARDIADAPLRDFCERAKRELELNTGIQAQIQIPPTKPKTTQVPTISQSSLGAKGDSMIPGSLLNAHAFSTPIREILQIPKTTGKKRKETDSSPTEETPGKIMKTGTTEHWTKVVPKNGRRKASPKFKSTTIPFNPKPIGPGPVNTEISTKSNDPRVPGTQGANAPKGQNSPNSTNSLNIPPPAQENTLEPPTNLGNPQKTQGATGSEGPKSPKDLNSKNSNAPPQTKFHDDIGGAENSGSSKNRKTSTGVEYLFITISLLEKLSFPVHLVGDPIKRFRAHMGNQHCFEHYQPQFRMGPTIKIAKHMLNKARDFTMPGVDLIFQINTKSPIFFSRHANKPSKLNISKGIVSGIDRNLGEKTLKQMFGAEKHGITHIERIRDELWNITDKVKITFNKTIAPITVGTSITGLFHVIPSFFKVVRCQKCQKFGHGTRQCKAKTPRCARCAGSHYTYDCNRWYHVECSNCHSINHGAAYRGCPVAMAFDKQTKQRNSLLKENYEKQLRETHTNKEPTPAKPTPAKPQHKPIPSNQNTREHKQNTDTQVKYVTREEMVAFTAQAVNSAANFILEKMALNDEETLTELKKEILNCMTNLEIGQNNDKSEPPYKNIECSGETAHTTQSDPEPMEAQETEITAQADSTEVIDLTKQTEGSITEITESCSLISADTSKNTRVRRFTANDSSSSLPPIPRRKVTIPRTTDSKMRANMSATKERLNRFNSDAKKGKK